MSLLGCFSYALLLVALILLPPLVVDAFYIPSMEPKYYAEGDNVSFMVNSLRSLKELFPQEYYKLPFCAPKVVQTARETLGEIIWGDRRQNSLYTVKMKQNSSCILLPGCDENENNIVVRRNIDLLESYIENGYRGFMSIDNLPAFSSGRSLYLADCKSILKDMQYQYYRGYFLGIPRSCKGSTLIHNHLHFSIEYNTAIRDSKKFMIVGLKVAPYSINYDVSSLTCGPKLDLTDPKIRVLTTDDVRKGAKVYWTYSVSWALSDIVWATRWDAYLHSSIANSNVAFHWPYVCSSLVVVFMCATSVATILMRALHKDYNRYNAVDREESQEETGWKLVYADVFRPPDRAPLLASLVGNGFQLLAMLTGVLLFAMLGFLSPARRGALLTAIIFLFLFMSIVAGYVCGFLLKYFNRREWRHVFFCGCAFPGTIFGIYVITNIINWAHDSSDTVPFSLLLIMLCMWLLVSLPLTILGASFAFRRNTLENPVRVGRLAREIPPQMWANSLWFLFLVPPAFPLCVIFLELNFILQALWAGQVYYVFGFLALVFVLWVIISGLVTVFHLYYLLCGENHQWWWYSFIIPGGLGFYLFLYSVYFYVTELTIRSFLSSFLYFMYMGLCSYAYGIMAGSIGLVSGIWFVRTIYGNIKVE